MLAVTVTSRPSKCERVAQAGGDPGGEVLDLVVGDVLEDDRELVAAEPGQGVPGAHHRAQPVGHLDEQRVAGGVAEAVVDHLEHVEVQEHQDQAAPGPALPRQAVLDPVGEQQPVRQPGQGVVQCLVLTLPRHLRRPLDRDQGQQQQRQQRPRVRAAPPRSPATSGDRASTAKAANGEEPELLGERLPPGLPVGSASPATRARLTRW